VRWERERNPAVQLRLTERTMCPPSSCPTGKRFSAVGKQADPGRAPHGMQQQIRACAFGWSMAVPDEESEYAKDQVGVAVGGQRGDYFCV